MRHMSHSRPNQSKWHSIHHNVVLQSFMPLELLRLFDPKLIFADVKAQLGPDLHVRHCSAFSEHLTPHRCVPQPRQTSRARTYEFSLSSPSCPIPAWRHTQQPLTSSASLPPLTSPSSSSTNPPTRSSPSAASLLSNSLSEDCVK